MALQTAMLVYQQALLAALKSMFGDDALVTDGPPPPAFLQTGAVVWLGDVSGTQKTIGLSPGPTLTATSGPKEEFFEVELYASIYGPTTSQATNAHELQQVQAFGLLEQIAGLVRENPTMGLEPGSPLGVYVRFSEVGPTFKVLKGGNDQARETAIRFCVRVHAFLE